MKNLAYISLISLMFISFTGNAKEVYEEALYQFADNDIKTLVKNKIIQDAVKQQNIEHTSLSQPEVVLLDKQWRAERSKADKPLISSKLDSPLSKFLKDMKNESEGVYTEIFVMDNKGLNVGQSDPTSDYWQGDEAKWKKTYLVGPGAVHVGKLKKDESTQIEQVQLSASIVDTQTNKVIGSITVGINLEKI